MWPRSDPDRQRIQVLITDGTWTGALQDPCLSYSKLIANGIDLIVVGPKLIQDTMSCINSPNVYFLLLETYDPLAEQYLKLRDVNKLIFVFKKLLFGLKVCKSRK